MSFRPRIVLFASAALALTLSVSGCKSNTTPQNQATTSQPAANQPAAPDSTMPGANQPSASQPAAGQPSGPSNQQAAAPATPPPPAVISLPEGTSIRVRLDDDLGSNTSHAGDSFTATVADDVMKGGEVFGVLDVDSDKLDDFSQLDAAGLRHVVGVIERIIQSHTNSGHLE